MALKTPWTSPSIRSPDFPFARRLSNTSPTAGANNWFVRSLAVGSGDGRSWLNAFTTLGAAFTAGAAGDKFWVSEDHAETQSTDMALNSPGVPSNPCFIYCANHTGSVPPVSADLRTTATITTTLTGTLTFQATEGTQYYYGITFSCGSGANSPQIVIQSQAGRTIFQSCALNTPGTSGSTLAIGSSTANVVHSVDFINTTYLPGATSAKISIRNATFIWRNTASAITGANIPSTLLAQSASLGGFCWFEGVDFSALSGKILVGAINASQFFTFKDCKLGASVTVSSPQGYSEGASINIIKSDSSGTNYRHEKYTYEGSQVVETTVVRTGGSSDGTTPISWKLVTTANSKWVLPFEALPIAIWNDTVGSPITVTVEGIWGSAWVPQTDDIWIEVEGLGSAASPQGSFGTGSKADNLAAGTAWATSSEVWGGSTTAFKMTSTFTPQQKGAIYIYVKAAKASTTFYIDPKVALS